MNGSVDYVAMGCRIRTLRQARNVTQAQLAELLNISTAFMGHIERGTRVPSVDTLVRIAAELHVTLDQIVLGIEPENELLSVSSGISGKQLQKLNDVIRSLDGYLPEGWPEKS